MVKRVSLDSVDEKTGEFLEQLELEVEEEQYILELVVLKQQQGI